MIDLGRVAENLLVVGVLGGFLYIIWASLRTDGFTILGNIKGLFKK